jgi:hypothetical protein
MPFFGSGLGTEAMTETKTVTMTTDALRSACPTGQTSACAATVQQTRDCRKPGIIAGSVVGGLVVLVAAYVALSYLLRGNISPSQMNVYPRVELAVPNRLYPAPPIPRNPLNGHHQGGGNGEPAELEIQVRPAEL